jgi:hypothetical protein
MSKTLLLLCLALFLVQHKSQSTPVHSASMLQQTLAGAPGRIIAGNRIVFSPKGLMRIAIKKAGDVATTVIYARVEYDNGYTTEYGWWADAVVHFYEESWCETPYYVSGLTVNYRVLGYDNTSGNYEFSSSTTANGYTVTLAYGIEHDYADGTSQRWRDYHLSDGDYYIMY